MEHIFHSLNASKTQNYMRSLLAETPGTPPVERTQIPLQLFESVDQAFHIQTVVSPIRPKWLSKSVEHLSICAGSIFSRDWPGESIFLLPSGGNYRNHLLNKACSTSLKRGSTIVTLLPSSTGSHFFHYFCMPRIHDVIFMKGRVRFPEMGSSPCAPSILCVIRPGGSKSVPVDVLREQLT